MDHEKSDKLITAIETTAIDRALGMLILFLPLGLVLGVVRSVDSGVFTHLYWYFASYSFLIAVWFLRLKIPNAAKASILTGVLMLSGYVSLMTWGFVGVGPVLLLSSLIFTAIGRNRLLPVLWGVILIMVITGAAFTVLTNIDLYAPRLSEYILAPLSWMIFAVVLILLATIILVTLISYQTSINELVHQYGATKIKLTKSREQQEIEKFATDTYLESLPGLFFRYEQDDTGDFRLVQWNSNHLEITGYSPEELSGMKPQDWFHTDYIPKLENLMSEVITKGEVQFVAPLKVKSKKIIPLYVTAKSLVINGVPSLCGHGIDISKQVELESQLRQNQKMDALGTLAGGIAHDFNNILNGFFGFYDLIELADTREEQKEYVGELRVLSQRAKELVTQILSFSRREDFIREVFDLRSIITELYKFLTASIPASIEKELSMVEEPTRILGDPTQIYQVVLNLATNAYHAMMEAGGTLSISLSHSNLSELHELVQADILKAGQYAQIKITDTGIGIPEEIREKIFEPFFTTKESGKGTGMGLSVVHSTIRAHEGNILLTSEVGVGTSFTILLPLTEEHEKESHIDNSSESGIHNETILFVDDEETLRTTFPLYLTKLGYKVLAASNGIDALKIFNSEEKEFDIVISDQTMPGMSGLELSLNLRNIGYKGSIILFSGYSDDYIDDEDIRNAGISYRLTKPVEPHELAKHIESLLKSVRP